jgi:hypothetical protein
VIQVTGDKDLDVGNTSGPVLDAQKHEQVLIASHSTASFGNPHWFGKLFALLPSF